MRKCTISIIGAVAVAIALPASADARPKFGPGALLGMFAAPFGALLGARPSLGQRGTREDGTPRQRGSREGTNTRERGAREGAAARTPARATDENRDARAEPPAANRAAPSRHVGWSGPVFWPNASDDMFDYALFPAAADNKFWAYGFGDILEGVFAASTTNQPAAAADVCGGSAAASADRVTERIEQVLAPDPAKDGTHAAMRTAITLTALRSALTEAGERIKAACRTAMPATPPDRLDAMAERVWAMRDATLTMRIPLETFYASLTAEQKARLDGSDWALTGVAADATEGRAGGEPRACAQPAAGDWPARTIERVLRPSDEQRASLEALRMRLLGMGQVIMSACPAAGSAGPLGRLAAAMDRLDVMMFALMSLGPAVQEFYGSLSDKQKADLHKVVLHARRPGGDI
ncbi:MAG TPA: Spy/CpxP family protein refolding chaperone [Xanthobacteraceae bacterium]|nr:Spy/CpxP family protein refolding chaperone [Xanthobacteraceae bacterium]